MLFGPTLGTSVALLMGALLGQGGMAGHGDVAAMGAPRARNVSGHM